MPHPAPSQAHSICIDRFGRRLAQLIPDMGPELASAVAELAFEEVPELEPEAAAERWGPDEFDSGCK